jgi:hypothetical protein
MDDDGFDDDLGGFRRLRKEALHRTLHFTPAAVIPHHTSVGGVAQPM